MKNKISITIFLCLTLLTFGNIFVFGQIKPDEITPTKPKIRKYNIDPSGFIIIPDGFKACRTEGFIDAWFGYIESQETDFKMNFAAGTVESLFEKYKKQIVWTKVEGEDKKQIKFGLLRKKKEETMLASTGWIQFSSQVKNESDKDLFMNLVRSYSREKCDDCRWLPYKSQSPKTEKTN